MPKGKRRMADKTSEDTEDAMAVDQVDPELEEEEEARPSKKSKKSKKAKRAAAEQTYENGVLRALELQNFMNHAHLRIDFDPHVNFIVGKNGSGKSAIVNSLIAGFGHRAASTGRNTNSAKNLIMNGTDYAQISIHLANGGEDPWKPEEFGDTIIAERRIERTGAGTYKLRDGVDGHVRKSSHNEFKELCQHMNIQADNPCALLTQEHAKKFLHQGNEQDRYRFFLQAANLESRKHDLSETSANVQQLKGRLELAKEKMAEKEEIARKAQAEFQGAQKLKEIQKQLEILESLQGWALVGEKEQELADAQQTVEDAEAKAAELRESAVQAHDSQKHLEETLAELERQEAVEKKALDRVGDDCQRHHDRAAKTLKELKNARKTLAKFKEQIEDARENAVHLKQEQHNAMEALEGSQDAEKTRLMQETARAQEEQQKAQTDLDQLQGEMFKAKKAYEAALEKKREQEARLGRVTEEANAKESELKELKKAGFTRERQLHPSMPDLLALLKKGAKSFDSPPIGPLGLHVQMKKDFEHLAPAVDLALKTRNQLSFVVTSKKDEGTLRKMLKELKPSPTSPRAPPLNDWVNITIREPKPRYTLWRDGASLGGGTEASSSAAGESRSRRSDGGADAVDEAPAERPQPEAPTLLDVLDITCKEPAAADAIFNQLCDTCKAEFAMLFTSRQEAERVTYASKMPSPQGYACEKFGEQGRFFFRKGRTTGAENTAKAMPRLARDKASAIAQLETECRNLKATVAQCQKEFADADSERKQLFEHEKSLRKKMSQTEQNFHQLDEHLSQLQAESATDTAAMEVAQIHHDAVMAEKAYQGMLLEVEKMEEDVAEKESVFKPLKQKNDDNQARYEEKMKTYQEVQAEVIAARAPIKKSMTTVTQRRRELTEAEKKKAAAQEKCEEVRGYIERIMPQVEEMYGERVHDPEGRSLEMIKQQKATLEKKQVREQARTGGKSLEDLAFYAQRASALASKGREDMECVERQGEIQEAALKDRYKMFKKESKALGRQASSNFNERLSRKNHAGSLFFDHEDEALTLQVQRNSQDADSAATEDARNLSGGERSFTTLSFELAMWEFCATPFRVLDEFDVFMDDTYRKQAVETLMELCDSQPQRQFLFITPQDMHPFLTHRMADASKTMPTITKMKDPRPKGSGGATGTRS